jgi:hypothetical protein
VPADVQIGICNGAVKVCTNGVAEEPDYTLLADYEAEDTTCNDVDNDCDGIEDEGFTALADVQDGVCNGATKVCTNGVAEEPDYTALPNFDAADDGCDDVDTDCDGTPDEDFIGPNADLQLGVCLGSAKVCIGGVVEEPDYTTLADYEDDEGTCDTLDNDCDGLADEIGGVAGDLCP